MIGRVVEIATDGRHLALDRGFLVVRALDTEVARTPIDDVAAVIGNAHGLSYSNNLLVALAERSIPFVLCGANHLPAALLWPTSGHHRQAARMDGQVSATVPRRKRLWRQLVRSKIAMQAAALERIGKRAGRIRSIVARVRVGDTGNLEGQAARLYWPAFFGPRFRRDRTADGTNAMLNYGYTVLRATVARHVMAAGLHPGVPLHHANDENPMRLVDDLMEPFRPLVDLWVRELQSRGVGSVDSGCKRALALLPTRTVHTARGASPVTLAIQRAAISLAQAYEGNGEALELPRGSADDLVHLLEEPADEPAAPEEEL